MLLRAEDITELMVRLDRRLEGVPVIVSYKSRGNRRFGFASYENLGFHGFKQSMTINIDNMAAWFKNSPYPSLEVFIDQTVRHEIAHLSAVYTKHEMSKNLGGFFFWEEMSKPRYKPHGALWKEYARRYKLIHVSATVPRKKKSLF